MIILTLDSKVFFQYYFKSYISIKHENNINIKFAKIIYLRIKRLHIAWSSTSNPKRVDLATYFHSSLAKMEEKMKIQDKIFDFSINLVKIHFKHSCFVFLSRKMRTLSLSHTHTRARAHTHTKSDYPIKWEKKPFIGDWKVTTRLANCSSLWQIVLLHHRFSVT